MIIRKDHSFLTLALALLIGACTGGDKPEQKAEPSDPNIRVVKEFYPNGRLKSSTEALGKLRHGESREYRKDGTLEILITYRNNRKHGPAKNYYPDGKTVKTELTYDNGYKQGESRWYYPDGSLYRSTPYVRGEIQGIRRVYYENGQLMAEIPYKDSQPGTGLKEYQSDGSPVNFDSKIVFQEVDRISLDNTFELIISLSDGYRNVEYFAGHLTEGKYWNERLSPIETENGVGTMNFFVSKGSFKMETINVIARIRTERKHFRIIQREYHLALENKF
jgi:antitoxin component YwqK of YwqJK toxin-antitoxin module